MTGHEEQPSTCTLHLLGHDTRRAIYELVCQRPGLNKNQIRNEFGLSVGVIDFHMERLETAQILRRLPSERDNEFLFFTEENRHLWENRRVRVLYGGKSTRNVALCIAEQPGVTSRQIADAMGIEPVTVRYHLGKLKEHELIGAIRVGNRTEYHPTLDLRKWCRSIGHRFPQPWTEDDVSAEIEVGSDLGDLPDPDGGPQRNSTDQA